MEHTHSYEFIRAKKDYTQLFRCECGAEMAKGGDVEEALYAN
jgi:hypothetical protein